MESQNTVHVEEKGYRKEISKGTYLCIGFIVLILGYLSSVMGVGKAFSVIMKTAHDLLINTAFYIMSVAVLAGAISSVFSEFGVTALLNKIISPIMKPLFKLPGAASLGAITCYFSDNPSIVINSRDPGYAKYFKKYQWATMINFGTTFGMGIIITGGILGIQGGKYASGVVLGTICAFIGGALSTRLLMRKTKKMYGTEQTVGEEYLDAAIEQAPKGYRKIREGSAFQRGLNATFDGGKSGVQLGLSIIPGILIFTTLVMILTNGPSIVDGQAVYKGVAYEGTGLLKDIGDKLSFILTPLFGFANSEVLGPPLTSLGSCGASIAGAKQLAESGLLNGHDMAVYFAIAYCWAGFLSSHASIADSMKTREITTYAMMTHFIGGIVAGVIANYAYMLIF
ncbi:CD0519/CD1768 family membrane protein [Clostridium luticellarii]|jgi:hypothetical protein|uniref:CD0519/CD1768 family membrane protein n=1 Tax=Clostridium luticellarii TaxID=1691940 RepID=UPI0023548F90|nr:hypothetical protein [Clostridium luticellarii]MCI1997017.1 hypothetical protein [Clostridium luticellarii]